MDSTTNGSLQVQLREKIQRLNPGNGFSAPFPPTGWPQHMRTVFREISVLIRNVPDEDWDDLGTKLASRFDEAMELLAAARDGILQEDQRAGRKPRSTEQLQNDIRELQQLKTDALASWPWSNQELPPVDREMVKASMEALARGEQGESIDALIARLNGASR